MCIRDRDYFAKRTFEESGNYSVGNFKINVAECLDDGISNEGVFKEGEITDQNGKKIAHARGTLAVWEKKPSSLV